MKRMCCSFAALIAAASLYAQFSQADSLRGGYGATRNWWDLTHYDLHVTFHTDSKTISGHNTLSYKELPHAGVQKVLQIDLQQPLVIDSVTFEGLPVAPERMRQLGNAYLIETANLPYREKGTRQLTVYFHGKPRQAVNAPWDGGVIWSKDPNGNPWITVACQGLGASVWFPCKDSQADEPDSATMHYTCDARLKCISNGHFTEATEHANGTTTYSWHVSNPINNYCMIPYIGDYVNSHEHFKGEKGMLEVDYWVLRGNEEKAEQHFGDALRTLEALEYWFGPYPFYEDGYKLIEAPHLGMEHQSAIAYGNKFQKGYLGTDLSGTGEGLKWDFIIVHESGHEWFGNNITTKDIADMWVHESFTNYSETLFMDYWYGTVHGNTYCRGLRKNILNDRPIIGHYGVQNEGSGDMYYKGANMLHTIRQVVANDSLFRSMLRGMNARFYHQTVTTAEIETYMETALNVPLKTIFDQYLRTTQLPLLEIKYRKTKAKYRWKTSVRNLQLPVRFELGSGKYVVLTPARSWQKYPLPGPNAQFEPAVDYYIRTSKTGR